MLAPTTLERQLVTGWDEATISSVVDDLLAGKLRNEDDATEALRPFGFVTGPRAVMLLVVPASARADSGPALTTIARKCVDGRIAMVARPRGLHQLILLAAPSTPCVDRETRRELAAFADRLSHSVRHDLKVAAVVGVSSIVHSPAALSASFSQARSACARAAFLGGERVVFADDGPAPTATDPYPLQLEREICARIREGSRESVIELAPRLAGEIARSTGGDPKVTRVRAGELIAVASRAALEAGADADNIATQACAAANTLGTVVSLSGLRRWLEDVLAAFVAEVAGRPPYEQRLIDQAVSFIRRNFAQELTLQRVADAVHVSPFYLSHMFRKQCNCTFLQCLTRSRIEHAKRLLEQSGLPISEIGGKVGYVDANYFAQVFRRVAGMTPSAYRRNVATVRRSPTPVSSRLEP